VVRMTGAATTMTLERMSGVGGRRRWPSRIVGMEHRPAGRPNGWPRAAPQREGARWTNKRGSNTPPTSSH
jgi:hypothetical protein